MGNGRATYTQIKSTWGIALTVFVVAFLVRLAFIGLRGPQLSSDSYDYLRLAQNVFQFGSYSLDLGPPFSPSLRWPPLYPFFLAALDAVGCLKPTIIVIIQAVLDSLTALLIVLISSRLVKPTWTFIAGIFYAIHPAAIYAADSVLTETLFTICFVSSIWILCRGVEKKRLGLIALSGAAIGLAVLCRPAVLLLPFLISALLILFWRSRRAILYALVLPLTMGAILTPWAIRSSRAAGRLVVVQDPVGFALLFYVASHWDWDQKDQSAIWPRSVADRRGFEAEEMARTGRLVSKPDQLYFRAALNNIRMSPSKYLLSRLHTIPYLFLSSYDDATGIRQSFRAAWAERNFLVLIAKGLILLIFSVVPFVLGVVGLVPSRKNIIAALCASVWLYTLCFYFPIWLEPRYWTPCIPFLIVSAAVGSQTTLKLFKR